MDITKKMNLYLQKETTTTGDIALPPDKASTKTKAGQCKNNPNRKGKGKLKKLLLGKDGEKKTGESG